MAKHKGLTFYEKKKKISKEMIHEIAAEVFYCIAAVLLAFVIVFLVGMKISVIGVSMEPSLQIGQVVLFNRFIFKLFYYISTCQKSCHSDSVTKEIIYDLIQMNLHIRKFFTYPVDKALY